MRTQRRDVARTKFLICLPIACLLARPHACSEVALTGRPVPAEWHLERSESGRFARVPRRNRHSGQFPPRVSVMPEKTNHLSLPVQDRGPAVTRNGVRLHRDVGWLALCPSRKVGLHHNPDAHPQVVLRVSVLGVRWQIPDGPGGKTR